MAAVPSMHTKQWLSKQGTWPTNGLLGCGDMAVWFYFWRHEYEVVGSSKRYILYLGKQAESYKVMIYAPPCLETTVAEGVDDRKASPPRVSAGAHEKGILEAINGDASITTKQNNRHGKGDNSRHGTTIRIYRRERLLTG